MSDENNDGSSSSEDEISKDALREATDHQFLKDSYFLNKNSEDITTSKKNNKHSDLEEDNNEGNAVSLRRNLDDQEKFSNFGVSPSFQNYVAKKLDEIIEKSIRIKEKASNSIINEKNDEENNRGIKLLNSSAEFLTTVDEDTESQKVPKKRKIEALINDKEYFLKCKEVAVDPERILSKADTKAWTSRRGEPEFKYKKLKNGTLVEKS